MNSIAVVDVVPFIIAQDRAKESTGNFIKKFVVLETESDTNRFYQPTPRSVIVAPSKSQFLLKIRGGQL